MYPNPTLDVVAPDSVPPARNAGVGVATAPVVRTAVSVTVRATAAVVVATVVLAGLVAPAALSATALGRLVTVAPAQAVVVSAAANQTFLVGATVSGSATGGLWTVDGRGVVAAHGRAAHRGDTAGLPLFQPIVGMAATPGGGGYWLVAADGGVFAFGDAAFHGSAGGLALVSPIVGMATTPGGGGYWLVAADGGVFAFGDAAFHGSAGGLALVSPIVGMATTPGGGGYWLAAADGGVFAFGDAAFHGSTGGVARSSPVKGIVTAADGGGYRFVDGAGQVAVYGRAPPVAVPLEAAERVTAVGALAETGDLVLAVERVGVEGGVSGALAAPAEPTSDAGRVVAGLPAERVATWEALAACESGGNWAINTGNGYHGGLQFSAATWRSVGGTGLPNQHSREEQIYRGELLLQAQGWGAWPGCARRLGLR